MKLQFERKINEERHFFEEHLLSIYDFFQKLVRQIEKEEVVLQYEKSLRINQLDKEVIDAIVRKSKINKEIKQQSNIKDYTEIEKDLQEISSQIHIFQNQLQQFQNSISTIRLDVSLGEKQKKF